MDIRVIDRRQQSNQVFTNSGVQLVGAEASTLVVQSARHGDAEPQWDADPTRATLGTLAVHFPNGGSLDLIQTNSIRSAPSPAISSCATKRWCRRKPSSMQFAANMSSLLSDKTTAGTAVSSGASNGFDLDLSGLQTGNA